MHFTQDEDLGYISQITYIKHAHSSREEATQSGEWQC